MTFLSQGEFDEPLIEDRKNNFQLFLQTSSRLSNRRKGVSVVWKDLTVVAEIRKQKLFRDAKKTYKSIVHNVSGAIFPGSLVAIMGASGAGKTTLMSVLSNRCPSGFRIDGEVRIDGQSIEKFDKRVSGYVYQDDLFMNCLTVWEHLNFVAKLRLDRNIDESDRKQLILKTLKEIGLLKIANRRIGNSKLNKEKTCLSGGERKRLSVATELLTEPMLLFCDEPTTGLDSFTAQKTITMLQSLAVNHNKTIICSIHQPNQQIFELFKQIVLLSQGRIVFNGSPDDAKVFFQSQGYQYTEEQNLAEYFIKSIANRQLEEKKKLSAVPLHVAFSESEYSAKIKKYVDNVMKQNNSEVLVNSDRNKIQMPSWSDKFITVSHRNFLEMHRNSSERNMRIFQKVLIGILIGLCLHGAIQKTQPGLRAFQAAVYIMFNQNFYPSFYVGLTRIPEHLPLFYREYSNNSLTPLMFFLSSIITALPFNIVEPLSYSLVIYYLSGLNFGAYAVIMSSIVNILLYNATAALGVLFSVLFKSHLVAQSYGNPVLNVIMFSCGLFIRLSSLPPLIAWIKHISWFTYACSAIYQIQLKNVYNIECESNVNVPCLRTGREVLKLFDFDRHSLSHNISMMIVIYLFFNLVAYIGLLFKIKRRTV
ncbi:protein scarlet-like [Planococcus citri]|uniref:protein scarlet-like n=1 Tax=Planococcus citri TaxID=170843 RepID=UPI0031F8DE4E